MNPIPDYAPLLEKCFSFDAVEKTADLSVKGEVPEWLRGSCYMISPARFERGGRRYTHWADGDGMVTRLEFTEDGVEFTSRMLPAETGQPAVNSSLQWYSGRLMAFGDHALPYELDPETLETTGTYDFGGVIDRSSGFSGRPRIDRHLVNFEVSYAEEPALQVYEFDLSGALLRKSQYPIGAPRYVREFGLSKRRITFFVSPLSLDMERFRQGGSVMESLTADASQGSRILVAPRIETDAEPFWVDAGNGFCLAVINAFEDEPQLIFDVLESPEPPDQDYAPVPDLFTRASICRAVRYVIDCQAKTVSRMEMDYDHISAFPSVEPSVAGRYYTDFWMLGIKGSASRGRKFFDELAHGHWARGYIKDIYEVQPGEYLAGMPLCVKNPDKRQDAVVIVQQLLPARERSGFLIFDAHSVRTGPVARLTLKHRLHPGFHAIFVPE